MKLFLFRGFAVVLDYIVELLHSDISPIS